MKTKQNIFQLIWGVAILVSGISIANAAEPFENLDSNTVIAEVLGQKVYLGNIDPNTSVKQKHQAAEPDEKNNLWLRQTRSSNLGRYFKPLWDEYVKEKELMVTEQEIREFKERMISLIASQMEQQKKKRDNLAKELIAENIESVKRTELEKKFDLYNRLIEKSPDPKLIYYPADSNIAKQSDNMTKTFILRWKMNRELYKQYKGRVIFQQAGPEPVDAYRRFFEEQHSKGKFKFYNKDAEDLFWDYYRNANCDFHYEPNEAEQLMNTPWWLKEKEDDDYDKEVDWSNDVNGLQIRIKASVKRGDSVFLSDKIPAFRIDLLNTGSKTFNCTALEQFCEVEIDGKWYMNITPGVAGGITIVELYPKKVQYDFLEIKLNENWFLKDSSGQNDKSHIMPLSLGSHTIRVKYKTMVSKEKEIEVFSNSLKFKIIPPRSKKSGY